MVSALFFVAALFGLLATVVATFRVRHPSLLSFPVMMLGWLTGEHAVHALVTQAISLVIWIPVGALDRSIGWVGLGLTTVSWLGLARLARRWSLAHDAFDRALTAEFPGSEAAEPPVKAPRNPFAYDHTGVRVVRNFSYGPHGARNLLDLYVPDGPAAPPGPWPVLLQVHGGAWVTGNKDQQGKPLLLDLARRGWLGVAINYRLGPTARFPAELEDVKRAIAWIRANVADHGGDASFLAVSGGSAGGHLTNLAALTANDPRYQPGFEDVDTTVQAAVPYYGPSDFTDRLRIRKLAAYRPFLEWKVMPTKLASDPEGWDAASPITLVRPDAPPFLVIQGSHDVLVWREETRAFVDALRAVSDQPVLYVEIPDAQHAFDVTDSVRSNEAARAVARFLRAVHERARVSE